MSAWLTEKHQDQGRFLYKKRFSRENLFLCLEPSPHSLFCAWNRPRILFFVPGTVPVFLLFKPLFDKITDLVRLDPEHVPELAEEDPLRLAEDPLVGAVELLAGAHLLGLLGL